MKRILTFLLAPAGAIVLAVLPMLLIASCSNDATDEVPGKLYDFVSRYYPFCEIADYSSEAGGMSVVTVKDGPTFYFDSADAWVRIDGNGFILPQMLLYDLCPAPLYRYLEELEATGGVYALERDAASYGVTLQDAYLSYDIANGQTTYEKEGSEGG